MKTYNLVIVGGGPAGLSSAIQAAKHGIHVLLIERSDHLGGQLIKQTHKFFGSKKQHASTRGYDIASLLMKQIQEYQDFIEVKTGTTVVAIYRDFVISLSHEDEYYKIQAQAIIIATGASEKYLAFENNDLPGIYGAGAVQTLMNQYGVLPGSKIVMVGSGNIGLIVSYQLAQAGVEVLAVIEASNKIGGYLVHASKIRRLGIPIYTSRTIKKAIGKDSLEKIVTVGLNQQWQEVEDSNIEFELDALCISVGLTPMHQLLSMMGVKMKYIKELGGKVPQVSDTNETSVPNLFVCGDVSGIEEASSAMIEGEITGIVVSNKLGFSLPNDEEVLNTLHQDLKGLRDGPFGSKTRIGLSKLRGNESC